MVVFGFWVVIVHAWPLLGLKLPNTSLRKLERLASRYFNLCSVWYVCVRACLRFGHLLAATLHFLCLLFLCLHGCLYVLKMWKWFPNHHVHMTISNRPKCNPQKDKIWWFSSKNPILNLCKLKWIIWFLVWSFSYFFDLYFVLKIKW